MKAGTLRCGARARSLGATAKGSVASATDAAVGSHRYGGTEEFGRNASHRFNRCGLAPPARQENHLPITHEDAAMRHASNGSMGIRILVMALAVGILQQGCAYYTGVAVKKEEVYLLGGTSFFGMFSSPWVKRCQEDSGRLVCQEMSIDDGPMVSQQVASRDSASRDSASSPAPLPSQTSATFTSARDVLLLQGYKIQGGDEGTGVLVTSPRVLRLSPGEANCGTTPGGRDYLESEQTQTSVSIRVLVAQTNVQALMRIDARTQAGDPLSCSSRGVIEAHLVNMIKTATYQGAAPLRRSSSEPTSEPIRKVAIPATQH